jgi:5'-nucleotidase
MRVLVTNDDGHRAPGLHALAASLADDGHEVLVVAPATDCSGFSAALGPLHATGRVTFERHRHPDLSPLDVVALDGPPALCVLTVCLGGFGPVPDLVVSGINDGANTGRAVLHSGTVGAALTANSFGVPAIAVSRATGGGGPADWATAARAATALARWMVHQPAFTLNVNVPAEDLGPDAVRVGSLDPGGQVQTAMVETGRGELELRVPPRRPTPGSDAAVLADGFIVLTALHAVHARVLPLDGAVDELAAALAAADGDQRVA